jgi:Nucleoside-diphosphate-sugar pyrophosphorylase involved in lipopolysaccharide biosynthesis/translation initiation factor 2B, gamma/epsilon subunits (eIF-2Bgamma/eIF-2Bepsilon)
MNDYRPLTTEEIEVLKHNDCWAEDWTSVNVSEDFKPNFMHRVMLYGEINIGSFNKNVEVSQGFVKHSGINNATLRNVTIGDDCLIENVGNFINNYTIGDDCYISNISTMETTEGATYGEGNLVSVLNEVGEGNVILFSDLNSQLAAFMVKYFPDKEMKEKIRQLIKTDIDNKMPDRGQIGNNVKIINTKEITNCVINDYCEVNGASRLSDCTLLGSVHGNVYIGTGVITENSIIAEGASVINSVKIQDCFVGEACQLSNGFTASASVFFANSYMSNGEACAAFCGPFTASHHKSSLLIGGMFSFYNAGSATNFSNHAYKMGPMHWGILERGSKTASGAYLLMPATLGSFSVCFGKLMHHPNTRNLPFAYLIADGDKMFLIPGRNITTVGLYRDIKKWPKRDLRAMENRKSIVNFDWLSPYSVGEILKGKKILENLREVTGDNVSQYLYHEYIIPASSLHKGIKYYDIALRIYMGAVLKRVLKRDPAITPPATHVGVGDWDDLSGLLLPVSEEEGIVRDVKEGTIENIEQLLDRFEEINANYRDYQWAWTYQMICDYYGISDITLEDANRIHEDYIKARRSWIAEIRKVLRKNLPWAMWRKRFSATSSTASTRK